MRQRRDRLLVVAAIALITSAHVGSPDTYFEGSAGPYPVRVTVRTPGVVPGLAQITVRLLAPRNVRRVLVVPVFWDPRTAAPPPPDVATRVPGDSALYSAALWLMREGAYSVQVTVDGPNGSGTTLVPVMALATRRLELPPTLAVLLLGLGVLLFAGAVTLVGAAVRESVLDPGATPDRRDARRARIAVAGGGLLLALALLGGRAWWNTVDAGYRSGLYRPLHASASVRVAGRRKLLRLAIDDPAWNDPRRRWAPLIPDHGHLVHLFLVRDSGLAAFAHLHPVPRDAAMFETALPPLPAGRYRVYADIVHESGLAETLVATVDLVGPTEPARPADPDDAWAVGAGRWDAAGGDVRTPLRDGSTMIWQRGDAALVVDREAPLRFVVRGPAGRSATLEPYMGMAGHLMLAREDGAVFVHLHPSGTISLAAQESFALRQPGDTAAGALAARLSAMSMSPVHVVVFPGEIAFPYAFPAPGRYRLWVQVKRNGRILTAVFDAMVERAGASAR